ncbi:MAG: four helix bundle protein [Acidobacteria bacterium RBG_16_68_9]|nr:MAG: four helix bundle protein [Acidobacteria bacterium RBG_16_68_9]
MQDFRKLKVWEKAHALVLDAYRSTQGFPRDEAHGLTAQVRRAAVSIPSNIAEGCGRSGDREFARFLRMALGSASELEYHYLLAHDLALLTDGDFKRLTEGVIEVKRMLTGLVGRMKRRGPES